MIRKRNYLKQRYATHWGCDDTLHGTLDDTEYSSMSEENFEEFKQVFKGDIYLCSKASYKPYEILVKTYCCQDQDNNKIIVNIKTKNKWRRHELDSKCPICGHNEVMLTRYKGEDEQGSRFVGCSNYPQCNHRVYEKMEFPKIGFNHMGINGMDIDEEFDCYGLCSDDVDCF